MNCDLCALRKTAHQVVWGDGPTSARLWFVGEGPGEQEDLKGRPFVGRSGAEHDNYLKLVLGMPRHDTYTTNLVKCRPPGNRDPLPEEIAACRPHLEAELAKANEHTVIVALGRYSSGYLLNRTVKMEHVHGIPQRSPRGFIVIPCYHPAVGMYSTSMMQTIMDDYAVVKQVLEGTLTPEDFEDEFPEPDYRRAGRSDAAYFEHNTVVAVDTESVRCSLFSVQISVRPGESIIFTEDYDRLKPLFDNPDNLFILHNAQHDLKQLAQVGLRPQKFYDTMLAANLLQNLPRGLKALGYRLCGMRMSAYEDIISPLTQKFAFEYLLKCLPVCESWPRPPKNDDGKHPHKTYTKINGILRDYRKNQELDLYARYENLNDGEKDALADVLGDRLWPATVADLDDVSFRNYAGGDSDATLRIYQPIRERIRTMGLDDALDRDIGIVPCVIQMEETGVGADRETFECLDLVLEHQKQGCAEEIEDLVGYYVNPKSDKQVRELLFNRLRLPSVRRTQAGLPSTEDEALELLRDRHPVVPLIQDYRAKGILQCNFVSAVLRDLQHHGDGRVRPDISLITAVTGRLASKVVNLIAWPKDKELRRGFVAKPGCVFLSGDYSQIELRVLAHVAQEPTMLQAFREGLDLHRLTAADVTGKRLEDVTDEERQAAKRVNFGVPYGISAKGLHAMLEHLGWTLTGCEQFLAKYFLVRKKVALWMDATKAEARRHGYVRDFLGRICRVPEVKSVHHWIRSSGERQAINAPIQMGAQSIMKVAMAKLWPYIEIINQELGYCRVIIQIHDDLKLETEERLVPVVLPIVKHCMETAVKISVPIPVEFKMGKTWGSMEEVHG